VRQVGVRIEDPPANSMASFKFTNAEPLQGTTFVFGSWVCIADGTGGFHQFTIDTMKLKTPAASFHSDLDEFVDNLDDLSTHGSTKKTVEESVVNTTPPSAATTSLGSDPLQSKDLRNRNSVYAIRPLNIRRPTILSPSPHWRRIWNFLL
jgi:hypothetical protein